MSWFRKHFGEIVLFGSFVIGVAIATGVCLALTPQLEIIALQQDTSLSTGKLMQLPGFGYGLVAYALVIAIGFLIFFLYDPSPSSLTQNKQREKA
jgi:hypothetical protein